ncbi:MAG: TetR family transcriptional regulator [Solirubrobacteraceae bacterium]
MQTPCKDAALAPVRQPRPGRVDEFQRARILAAMAELACQQGPEQVTVTKVIARVRVTRRTFYDLFADREECLLEVVDEALQRAGARACGAFASDNEWVDRLRAGLLELLLCVEVEPDLARLCLLRLNADEPEMRRRRRKLLRALAAGVEQGRATETSSGSQRPPLVAEALVGAIASLLYTRLLAREPVCARELLGPLMSVLVLPYLGSLAAHRELSRPAPPGAPAHTPTEHVAQDTPQPSISRVTYRTARVLSAIAASPGANNRDVAQAAGVKDQGQISRLLSRLQHLGLIENLGGGASGNAWHLTDDGRALSDTIGLAPGGQSA